MLSSRAKFLLVSGTKFEDAIQGDSIVLTPQSLTPPQLVEDALHRADRYSKPTLDVGIVTNDVICNFGWIPETGQGGMLVRRCFLVYRVRVNLPA